MTVTPDQINRVRSYGIQNVEHIADACNRTGCRFYIAVAMIIKESRGRNVYGNDQGGVLSGFKEPVDKSNYLAFRHEVITKGRTSNGVGPAQLTFKGFFTDMENDGLKPWLPSDNIYYGVKLIYGYYRTARDDQNKELRAALEYAGTKYNGASAYGVSFATLALEWKNKLGNADYA